MVDDVVLNPGTGGDTIAAEDIAGIKYQLIKIILGADGSNDGPISATNPLPVLLPTGLATSAKQDSIITALTTLLGYNDGIETLLAAISGKDFATQTTLAALLAKVIAAPSTEAKQDAVITKLNSSVAVTGPLTDAQLRATAIPVSGTFFQTTQPVSAASLPLPTGAATEASLLAIGNKLPSVGPTNAASSQPVVLARETASGTITTQNLVANGAATANSAVEITLNGCGSLAIQITGTYTGALSIQVTNDGSRWETVTASSLINFITGAYTATITSATIGVFQVEVTGWLKARITGLAAMTGTATVTLSAVPSSGIVTIDNALPTGANVIGAVTQSGTFTVTPANTANTTAWAANPLTPATGTTGDTGAKTATGNGATQTNATSKGALIVLNLGTVSGTTPTLVLKLQGSADGGTTWVDIPGATTASLTATGVFGIQIYPGLTAVAGSTTTGTTAVVSGALPRSWRAVWTIGGTTPSFTITNVQVSYLI